MKRVKRKLTPLLKLHLEMQQTRIKNSISYDFFGKNIATTKGTFYSNRYGR